MSNKNFKVKNGLQVPDLSTAGVVTTDSSGNITSVTTVPIANGGTGQTTAANAINALLPIQSNKTNYFLQSSGTDPQWSRVWYQTIQNNGTAVNPRQYLNVVGATFSDDSQNDVTTLTVGGAAMFSRWKFTAAGSETSLSGNDDNGKSLVYAAGYEIVNLNGIQLVRGSDYTATNGTSITNLAALTAGDVIEVLSFTTTSVANAVDPATFTTKGDVIVGTGNGTYTRVGVGSNNQVLMADSSQTAGVKWATASLTSQAVSSDITLAASTQYFVDTTSARTLTLPSSPNLGDSVYIYDASGLAFTNNITINSNSGKINGSIQNATIDINGGRTQLIYTGSSYGWSFA